MPLADTTGWDALIELFKLLGVIAGIVGAVLAGVAAKKAGDAKAAAGAANDRVGSIETKVDTAATHAATTLVRSEQAAGEAKQARQKTDSIGAMLSRVEKKTESVEKQTNGINDALRKELAETRRKLEEVLAAQTPVPVTRQLDTISGTLEQLVTASKSGTKLSPPVDPANPPKRRHDDPKE